MFVCAGRWFGYFDIYDDAVAALRASPGLFHKLISCSPIHWATGDATPLPHCLYRCVSACSVPSALCRVWSSGQPIRRSHSNGVSLRTAIVGSALCIWMCGSLSPRFASARSVGTVPSHTPPLSRIIVPGWNTKGSLICIATACPLPSLRKVGQAFSDGCASKPCV